MADDKPSKPKPTYEQLAADNAALRTRAAALEAQLAARDAEEAAAMLRAKRTKRPKQQLDPKAASQFLRPYDGR